MGKYLITGGCGFIGRHLTAALLARGDQVRIVDDLSNSSHAQVPQGAELIVADLNECVPLEDVDGCFHLAAMSSVPGSIKAWASSHHATLSSTVALFEKAKERQVPIVFTSSAAVYGNPQILPTPESAPLVPLSPYAADKIGCELHAQVAWNLFQVPTVGFRLFNIYGPGSGGVISLFECHLRAGTALTFFGSGEQQRDFVHVNDVVTFLMEAMEQAPILGGRLFNLCSGKATTVVSVAMHLQRLLDVQAEIRFLPMREGDILNSLGDPTLLEKTFGHKPGISIDQGLKLSVVSELCGF